MAPINCLVALFLLVLQVVASEWIKVGVPHPQLARRLTFAIKQNDPEWLKERLRAVSYPDSPEYGDYMNFDEIARHVYGRPESVAAVLAFLNSVGVASTDVEFTLGKDFAIVYLPVHRVEKLFSTTLYEFNSSECVGAKAVSSESPIELPSSIKTHLDFVTGIHGFPKCEQSKVKRLKKSNYLEITPETIAADYNTSKYVSTNPSSSQGIAGFLRQYYDPQDLADFQMRFNIPKKPIAKVIGKNIDDDPGAEANLDVQYISATGRGVDTWFVSISTYSNGHQEDFVSWITTLINNTGAPWVHSASYGDLEKSIDPDYLFRMDNEFMKFGISGRTVLFASGDSGVECKFKGGKLVYTPNWPASSPYVTTVGGTASKTEVWSSSGGGFSNYFGMPDYQKEVVEAYIAKIGENKKFNRSGRAYPDVSAFSVDFVIIDDGGETGVDGTSCAAPTFAGIVSSLNDVRLNKGLKTLGFMNPLLYQTLKGQGFNDVTEGSNGNFACEGFKAASGWDPASGWGSPNFGLLRNLVST